MKLSEYAKANNGKRRTKRATKKLIKKFEKC